VNDGKFPVRNQAADRALAHVQDERNLGNGQKSWHWRGDLAMPFGVPRFVAMAIGGGLCHFGGGLAGKQASEFEQRGMQRTRGARLPCRGSGPCF